MSARFLRSLVVAFSLVPASLVFASGKVVVSESVPAQYASDARMAQAVLQRIIDGEAVITNVFSGPSGFLGYIVEADGDRMILWQTPRRDMILSGVLFDMNGRNLSQLAADAYEAKTPTDVMLAQYELAMKKELENFFARIKQAIDVLPTETKSAFYRAYSEVLEKEGVIQVKDGSAGAASSPSSGSALLPEMSISQGCGADRRQINADSSVVPSVFVPVSPLLAEGFRDRLRDLQKNVDFVVLGDQTSKVRVHVFADAHCRYSRNLVEAIRSRLKEDKKHLASYRFYPVAVFSPLEEAASIFESRDVSRLASSSPSSSKAGGEVSSKSKGAVEASTAFLRKYVGYDATPFVVLEKDNKFWLMVGPKPELIFEMIGDTTGKIDLYAQIR